MSRAEREAARPVPGRGRAAPRGTGSDPARDACLRYLGEQVRGLRVRRYLSQAALAGQAGVGRSFLSDVERGRTNVSLEVLWNLARALGVSVRDLLPPDQPHRAADHRRARQKPRA